MVAFFQCIRWKNLLLIALMQWLIKFTWSTLFNTILSISEFLLLNIATLCICAGGYVINDLLDQKADSINKPLLQTIPHKISVKRAKLYYILLNFFGLLAAQLLVVRMNRIHNSFAQMAKGGMVDYISDQQIYHTKQSIWKLNNDKYFEIRKRYED